MKNIGFRLSSQDQGSRFQNDRSMCNYTLATIGGKFTIWVNHLFRGALILAKVVKNDQTLGVLRSQKKQCPVSQIAWS